MYFIRLVFLGCCFLLQQLLTAQVNTLFSGTLPLKDITYKITPQHDTVKLDIYPPVAALNAQHPVVVFIHGGAWAKGDKDLENSYYGRSLRDTLRANGYAVVSINYRLINETTSLSEQVSDCRDALRWIAQHHKDYHFDTRNIGLWGASAGAHLALLIGYANAAEKQNTPSVNYVIDNFGPTDLNKVLKTNAGCVTKTVYKLFLPKLYALREQLILGLTTYDIHTEKERAIETAQLYSPITHLSADRSAPTLILHGTKDWIVPFKQSKKLYKKLQYLAVKSELVKVKKGDHGFTNIAETEIQILISRTVRFIKQHTY